MASRVLSIDFETAAVSDLRRVGADVYARDPTLAVTVVAWAFDDDPVQSQTCPGALPQPILDHLKSGGAFRAWNAAFEQAILTNHYGLKLDPHQASCTMQRALYSGLPAGLGDAGPALGVGVVKDDTAHRLMLQMAKPRDVGADGTPVWWHVTESYRLPALAAYCRRDVESEREIARHVRELPKDEIAVSRLDRRANELGVQIDLGLVDKLKALTETEVASLNRECAGLTKGSVTSPGTQTARLQAWLAGRGLWLMNLSKEAVAETLAAYDKSWAGSVTQRVLEIRQEVAKSSTRKLDAMTRCAGPDGRVRGQLAYYGAFRTGRFAGRLIQPQNFPKPSIRLIPLAVQNILDGADPEFLRLVYGAPLEVVASLLRSCLIPGPGKTFVVYDLAQIEARVVAWLAGQTDVLEVFERGEDVYAYTASRLGSVNRQFGKVLVLACGFGMGAVRFQDTAKSYGLTLTAVQCEEAVRGWREANPRIVDLWWTVDRAARAALKRVSKQQIDEPINDKLSLSISRSSTGAPLLTIRLPSGRRLYYRNARLATEPFMRDAIAYDGVDQHTKQWTSLRTYGGKLTENITQAVARDVIVEAALRVDRADLGDLVLSVHDELVFEVDSEQARRVAPLIQQEIDRRPAWALDLPVASEGGIKTRYGK